MQQQLLSDYGLPTCLWTVLSGHHVWPRSQFPVLQACSLSDSRLWTTRKPRTVYLHGTSSKSPQVQNINWCKEAKQKSQKETARLKTTNYPFHKSSRLLNNKNYPHKYWTLHSRFLLLSQSLLLEPVCLLMNSHSWVFLILFSHCYFQ